MFLADLKRNILRTCKGKSNCRYMRIVPSIIIYESSSIRKSSQLISIVPPRHNNRMLMSINPNPIISLTKLIVKHFVTFKSAKVH